MLEPEAYRDARSRCVPERWLSFCLRYGTKNRDVKRAKLRIMLRRVWNITTGGSDTTSVLMPPAARHPPFSLNKMGVLTVCPITVWMAAALFDTG